MGSDVLRQLTLGISLITLGLIFLSILRNRLSWKYSFNSLKKSLKNKSFFKYFLSLFLIFFTASLLFGFAYSSEDVSNNLAQKQTKNFLGDYSNVYISSLPSVSLDNLITYSKQSSYSKGIYSNTVIKNGNDYIPNVTVLGLDGMNISDNEYLLFSDENTSLNNIEIAGGKFTKSNEKLSLNNLDKFRGLSFPTSSKTLIVTNLKSAKSITGLENANILFTNQPINLKSYKDQLSDVDYIKSSYLSEINISSIQKSYSNSINPFNPLLLIATIAFLVLIYPLILTLRKVFNIQANEIEFLRSTGAQSGVITRHEVYFWILPFILLSIIASLIAYLLLKVLYYFINFSSIYSTTLIPEFPFNILTLVFIVTNIFSLFFLVSFLIFYSAYFSPKRYKVAKVSILKLAVGISSILFGIVIIFFMKDLPPEGQGLIPFILYCGPTTSLLGSTIFLRLQNKKRYLVQGLASLLWVIGTVLMFTLNKVNETPSGLLLSAIVGILILTSIINEWSYKDYPKLIISSIFTFLIVFGLTISSTGFQIGSVSYPFDFSVQTYTASDNSINFDTLFPENSITSKIQFAKAFITGKDDKGNNLLSKAYDLATVDKSALIASNLSDTDKDTFYSTDDYVILTPGFAGIDVKEGDTLNFQELISGKTFSKKVYKIMADNLNTDIENKIVFSNLSKDINTPHSSLNTIYLAKLSTEQKEIVKDNLEKYNIYNFVDISKKLKTNEENSISLLQSLKVLFIGILLVVLIVCMTKNVFKGFLAVISSMILAIITAILYQENLLKRQEIDPLSLKLLLIIFIFVIITSIGKLVYRNSRLKWLKS